MPLFSPFESTLSATAVASRILAHRDAWLRLRAADRKARPFLACYRFLPRKRTANPREVTAIRSSGDACILVNSITPENRGASRQRSSETSRNGRAQIAPQITACCRTDRISSRIHDRKRLASPMEYSVSPLYEVRRQGKLILARVNHATRRLKTRRERSEGRSKGTE